MGVDASRVFCKVFAILENSLVRATLEDAPFEQDDLADPLGAIS